MVKQARGADRLATGAGMQTASGEKTRTDHRVALNLRAVVVVVVAVDVDVSRATSDAPLVVPSDVATERAMPQRTAAVAHEVKSQVRRRRSRFAMLLLPERVHVVLQELILTRRLILIAIVG